jgi:uncharacterized protein (TIGR04141 family)
MSGDLESRSLSRRTDGARVYVLSSGAWYEVSIDFVQNVTDSIARVSPPPFALTAWNGADSEGEYNKACSGNHGFLNCDAKNIFSAVADLNSNFATC